MTSYAAERARLLLGCYRTGEANDPDTYVAAITAILARYPEEVITTVTHPATGLPSKKGWLPTIKEVTDACVEAVTPILERASRERNIAEQLAARAADDSINRPTLEALHAKYGKDWGLTLTDKPKDPKPQSMSSDQLRHHYQHYNLAFQPKPAEPD